MSNPVVIDGEIAKEFRHQLRSARENALKDAEAFDGIIHVIERLGSLFWKRDQQSKDGTKHGSLGKYKKWFVNFAKITPLSNDFSESEQSIFHTSFSQLYDIVSEARNDAMHIGASARHLTTHAIELALILEDALHMTENNAKPKRAGDYMVRNPIYANLWEPISFIRQKMLENSFSFLPFENAEKQWCLVSDVQIAKYLNGHSKDERQNRLSTTLKDATEHLSLAQAPSCKSEASIDAVLKQFDGRPILVLRKQKKDTPALMGILTAFDLL